MDGVPSRLPHILSNPCRAIVPNGYTAIESHEQGAHIPLYHLCKYSLPDCAAAGLDYVGVASPGRGSPGIRQKAEEGIREIDDSGP